MEFSPGQMADDMRVTTSMIRRRAKVPSTGQMDVSTREVGKMVNNTALANTPQLVARPNKANGKTERESAGSKTLTLTSEVGAKL